MTKHSGSQHCQIFGLPPRPVYSYQSPARRRPRKIRTSKFHDKENRHPDFKIPRVEPSYNEQPLSDASNIMTSLHYNAPSTLTRPLSSQSPFILCPMAYQSSFVPFSQTRPLRDVGEAYSDMIMSSLHHHPPQIMGTTRLPIAERKNSSGTFINTAGEVTITPTTRRRLAVEGVRKAVSDAALRKMRIQGDFGWSRSLEQPINFVAQPPKAIELDAEKQPELDGIKSLPAPETDTPQSSYSPRQYTPKPLLLPCKLARSNTTRSPPPFRGSLFSRQRTISYHRSGSPTETDCNSRNHVMNLPDDAISLKSTMECATQQLERSDESYDTSLEKGSTTPSDSSFASDHIHFGAMSDSQVDTGSTTPQESSFSTDEMLESHPKPTCHNSPGTQIEGDRRNMSSAEEKGGSCPTVMTAIMWTIAAPQKRSRDLENPTISTTQKLHRKSVGCLWGLSLSKNNPARHDRSSFEIQMSPKSSSLLSRTSPGSLPSNEMSPHGNHLPNHPIAQPTFVLPPPDSRKGVYANLRNLTCEPSRWPPFLRGMPSLSFKS